MRKNGLIFRAERVQREEERRGVLRRRAPPFETAKRRRVFETLRVPSLGVLSCGGFLLCNNKNSKECITLRLG